MIVSFLNYSTNFLLPTVINILTCSERLIKEGKLTIKKVTDFLKKKNIK